MEEIWIDGFNLFHRWGPTKALFSPAGGGHGVAGGWGPDGARSVEQAQSEAVHLLAHALGAARSRCLVFMDGGPVADGRSVGGLRLRYAGPGGKADDRMLEAIRARGGPEDEIGRRGRRKGGRVTAVTSDRALAATLRAHGVRIRRVEQFIAEALGGGAAGSGTGRPSKGRTPRGEPSIPEREAPLSAGEVAMWLREFEEPLDPDAQAPGPKPPKRRRKG